MEDDDMIPISALQHYAFCPRQCALIHIERVWREDAATAGGRILHEQAHEGPSEVRNGVKTLRGLALACRRLGIVGQADVVELTPAAVDTPPDRQAQIAGWDGRWIVVPVEYKRGRPKANDCDRIQVCAQALCLEEMLHVAIPSGALYYGQIRRRQIVTFDDALRNLTERTIREVRRLVDEGSTPSAQFSKACSACSLKDVCMPSRTSSNRDIAQAYLRRMLREQLSANDEDSNHETP